MDRAAYTMEEQCCPKAENATRTVARIVILVATAIAVAVLVAFDFEQGPRSLNDQSDRRTEEARDRGGFSAVDTTPRNSVQGIPLEAIANLLADCR